MSILYDARGNEFQGNLDQITGGTFTDARTISGNLGALDAESIMDLNGHSTAVFDIRGTFVATVSFEGTVDGTNYVAIPVFNQATEVVSLTAAAAGIFIASVSGFRRVRARVSAYTSGTVVASLRGSIADCLIKAPPIPATTWVTNTAASGSICTLSLAAAGAGLFHYITELQIIKFAAAALTAAAAPVIATTTNLTGSPAFSFQADGAAQGTSEKQQFEPNQPFKSAAANTATTIVGPATTSIIWRINAAYYVGA